MSRLTKTKQVLARGGGLSVVLADPDPKRRRSILRQTEPHRAIDAASLQEVHPLAETLAPEVLALAGGFPGEPEMEGIVRLADLLGPSVFTYVDAGRSPLRPAAGWPASCGSRRTGSTACWRDWPTRRQRSRVAAGPCPIPETILIGVSTGGIAAIEEVLSVLPADCPPTLVVQHIRDGFVSRLVQRCRRSRRCRGSSGGRSRSPASSA